MIIAFLLLKTTIAAAATYYSPESGNLVTKRWNLEFVWLTPQESVGRVSYSPFGSGRTGSPRIRGAGEQVGAVLAPREARCWGHAQSSCALRQVSRLSLRVLGCG